MKREDKEVVGRLIISETVIEIKYYISIRASWFFVGPFLIEKGQWNHKRFPFKSFFLSYVNILESDSRDFFRA